ncbi:probable BOI-related E3 ubiquitin- ligase 3 [Olea europaea subsp. europaea]|uniref:Probable BOI-related E3 ubiquitin- ligase 3 n=1 Tax=Olea europaea subsp. europaea TaxID=158383 RepID=A0A8S0V925_OLEEU|nr:probable BOI-related E3 ubiquitin- ligase 3 [Olea europaea subsp. europaea]
MAVEARHLNLFPPKILSNRETAMNSIEGIGNVNMYGTPLGYGVVMPQSGTTTATENFVPMYSSTVTDSIPAKTAPMKSDSGLSYALPVSRKRSSDAMNPLLFSFPVVQNQNANYRCGSFTFLGEDISFQFQQQQLEIDRFIAQQTEKVRMEMEERRKRYSRRIAAAVEGNIMKKLKAQEDEIDKIGKLNWALEERVKSLCVENQIWRDLAQTNEATANTLRCNLEQVLAQVQVDQNQRNCADEALTDDAQSCCGSNFEEIERQTLAQCTATNAHGTNCNDGFIGNIGDNKAWKTCSYSNSSTNRLCRNCGKEESSVLLLPCRHLCLCTVCGSSLHTCPVCNSSKTASLNVNLPS